MRIISSQMKQQAKRVLAGNRLTVAVMYGVIMAAALMQSVFSQLLMTLLDIEQDTLSVQLIVNMHGIRDIDYLLLQVAAVAVGFVIISPLSLGFKRAMTRLCIGKSPEMIDLFYYFGGGRYLRALGYMFALAVRCIGWAALLLAPAFAAQVAAESIDLFVMNAEWQPLAELLYAGSSILLPGGLTGLVFILVRYFASDYCYLLDGCATPRDCFAYSWALTKGHGGEILGLLLSFIGWYLLCLPVFPTLYVQPYVAATTAFTAVQLIGEDRRLSAELVEPQQ